MSLKTAGKKRSSEIRFTERRLGLLHAYEVIRKESVPQVIFKAVIGIPKHGGYVISCRA
jgi:hypothetical protein